MNHWGHSAMEHWQTHLPERYAALEDPQAFFTQLGEEAAAHHLAVRDSLLEGLSPNDGTMDWPEFQAWVAEADQTAREMVETEMIYLPPS